MARKEKEKDAVITNIKINISKLNEKIKKNNKKIEVNVYNTKVALKKGDKERAKIFLINKNQAQNKVKQFLAMKTKLEKKIEAIEDGMLIAELSELEKESTKLLKDISLKADPSIIAEVVEDSAEYIMQIDEASSILAGEPEIDYGIDVDDELNQLESEVLLEISGEMPEVPTSEGPDYISESDYVSEDTDLKTKDQLKKEIEKLKKELDE